MVEVVAALVWRDGKILICRRPADKARALLWEFPGGKVEAGETKQQALVRECREELAFEIVPGSVFCEVTHTYPDITIHLTLFNCTAKGEPQRLEHAELLWVQPQDVTAYDFCPADKVIVEKLARGVKLQTERLELRELTASDIDNLRPILQDADVMYAWEAPFTDSEIENWLAENLRRYKTDGFSFWSVERKSDGAFIGVCGPLIETINGVRYMGVAYIFAKAYWGNGYAAESAAACINYAFNTLGAYEVIAEIRPENKKSRHVAERLGMTVRDSFVKTYKGKAMPHLIYALAKERTGMFDLQHWLDEYVSAVDAAFGARIEFIGLQGSYARGEQHEGSDIDVVLLLDELTVEDLKLYREAIANLPHRHLLCGFVGGIEELKAWDRADLFQFYHDTKAIYGDLDFLAPLITETDVKRAVHHAACDIYHACAHDFVHERSAELLKGLYKAAFFALQAKYYVEHGAYISRKKDLLAKLSGADYEVLAAGMELPQYDLEDAVRLLFNWSGGLIKEYKEE